MYKLHYVQKYIENVRFIYNFIINKVGDQYVFIKKKKKHFPGCRDNAVSSE